MRLSFAVPAIAGLLLLGGAALAQTDAPPAAPIFYCPTPGKPAPAPAATSAKPAARAGHLVHTSSHRHAGCPTLRVATAERHHWRGHEHGARVLASDDVSASQAFIYRYERAMDGLDARAADEAWADGRHACPPQAHHCPGAWRHDGPPMEHGPVLTIAPPCPDHCPGPEAWRHGESRVFVERAPVPQVEAHTLPPLPEPAPPRILEPRPLLPAPAPAERPSVHAYAWQDGNSHYGYVERDQQAERAGGWSYSEQDGHGHYQRWGDHFAGEPDWDGHGEVRHDDGRHDDGHGERRWAEAPRYRCPPPVPAASCNAGPDAPVRHSDVAVAGRDAAGYLTWPGKTE